MVIWHQAGRGTSFKAKDLSHVLQFGAQQFFVSGKLDTFSTVIGVEYQSTGTQFNIAGQRERSRTELAKLLPLLFISPDSHALISDGPQQRRKYLDWGVFHVEPTFLPAWRIYQRALKQRNRALRSPGLETVWDIELARSAEQVTQARIDYLARLEPYVDQHVQQLVKLDKVTMNFVPGWRQDSNYLDMLHRSLPKDREFGFTRHGPHRADVVLKVGTRLARDTISRGQQKLLVFAMLLAQVALLNEIAFIQPVILIDDLAAELDLYHRERLLLLLSELKAQVFLTLAEERELPISKKISVQRFHVEQGRVTPS